jgi:predicted lipoprotein with Yx(FWY)xxD motif
MPTAPPATAAPADTVRIATTPALGDFLTDASGRTLYFFSKDAAGTSACSDTCLVKWPAFYAGTVIAPAPLQAADFGFVARTDGTLQSSYKGRPLYYFAGDSAPGTTKGHGVGNSWSVAATTGVMPVFATPTPTPAPTTLNTLSPYGGGTASGY